MSKKIVIRADLICQKSTSEIFATVAKLKGIKSIATDQEKNTVTVVGAVDPVCIVQELRKARFAATIVSVEDDKPKEPEKKKTPCQEACEKGCKERCEKLCKTCEKACKDKCEKDCKEKCDGCEKACQEACCQKGSWYGYGYRCCTESCNSSPCGLPGCHYYGYGYGYGYGVPGQPLGYGCYGRPF